MYDFKKRVECTLRKNNSVLVSKLYNKLYCYCSPIHYVGMEKIVNDTVEWSKNIGSDFDTVIAMPRSGLVVGSTLACVLGKSLSTPEKFINNEKWESSQFERFGRNTNFYGKVLLVDDSVVTGKQMKIAIDQLNENIPEVEIITAALYLDKNAEVDRYYKKIDGRQRWLCEYNLMHAKYGSIGYDMDGVLCEDWDGKRDYEEFLYNAKPYKIPVYPIDYVITARKEKYRKVTEQWLDDNNAIYEQLFMMPDGEKDGIKFKARILRTEKPQLYVESSDYIARKLHKMSGTPTVCIESNLFYK